MKEVWKAIDGYEGLYEVSNTGKVRSLNYAGRGIVKELKQKIDRYGYPVVHLRTGKNSYPAVHRLVAKAFIQNTDNLPAVNHIDCDKTNNNVDNLEWVSNKQNTQHALKNGLLDNLFMQRDIAVDEQKKPLIAVNIQTGEEIRFDSQNGARKNLASNAHAVANGKKVQSKGFVFFEPTDNDAENQRRKELAIKNAIEHGGKGAKKRKAVIATNLETGETLQFRSAAEAIRELPNNPCVYDVLTQKIKQSKGYTFRYADKGGDAHDNT